MKADLLDLSPNNAVVDLEAVALSGVRGVMVKATQGVTEGDAHAAPTAEQCVARCSEARAQRLLTGCYAYLMVRHGRAQDARQQCADYLAVWRRIVPDLRPCLDVELGDNQAATGAEFARAVLDWIDQCRHDTGLSPIVYTSRGEWLSRSLDVLASVSACPLWLAGYGESYVCPPPWRTPAAWQWTGTGSNPGVVGDVDVSEVLDWDALRAGN